MAVILRKIIDYGLCLCLGIVAAIICGSVFYPPLEETITMVERYESSTFDRYFVADAPYEYEGHVHKNSYLVVSGYAHYLTLSGDGLGANVYMELKNATYDEGSLFPHVELHAFEAAVSANLMQEKHLHIGDRLTRAIGKGDITLKSALPKSSGLENHAKGIMIIGYTSELESEILASGAARYLSFTPAVTSYGDLTIKDDLIVTRKSLYSLNGNGVVSKIWNYAGLGLFVFTFAFFLGYVLKRKTLFGMARKAVEDGYSKAHAYGLVTLFLALSYFLPGLALGLIFLGLNLPGNAAIILSIFSMVYPLGLSAVTSIFTVKRSLA